MQKPIAITGATGALGSLVAKELAGNGVPLRLLVRSKGDPSTWPSLPNGQVQPYEGYSDIQASARALKGCDVCYMVSGKEEADRLQQHYNFIDALVDAGVKHVVYTSFKAAAPDAAFLLARQHYETEQYIRSKSELSFTFLRNNLYQEALLAFASDGVIRGPAGKGRLSPIARQDIAHFSTKVLEDVSLHKDKTYTLTGPEDLNLDEIASILSKASGKTVTYVDETEEEANESRLVFQAPEWLLKAWISTYTAMKTGEMGGITETYPQIMGRPATLFRDFVDVQMTK